MARAEVNCKNCRKVAKYVSRGNRRDTDRYASWVEAQGVLCSDCWEKEQKELSQKSAESAKEIGLPALTGSEKQIAWAEKIRAEKLKELDKHVNYPTIHAFISELFKTQTDSKWFIDNRNGYVTSVYAPEWMITKATEKVAGHEKALHILNMLIKGDPGKLLVYHILKVVDLAGVEF